MTAAQTEASSRAKPERAAKPGQSDGFLADFSAFSHPKELEGWLVSSETLMKNAFELTRQCIDFSEARLHEDFKTLEKLMGCTDFAQISDCQKVFAAKASKQYIDQFNGMTRHLAGLMGAREGQSETGGAVGMPD